MTILLPLWLIQETNAWIQGGDVREISNEASTSAPPHATIKWKVIQRPSIINHQRLPSPCFSVTGSRTWRCISQTWKIYFSKFSWRCISNMKIYFEHFRVLSNVRSINYHEDANPTGMAWKLTLGQNYRNMMCPRMASHSWQFQHMKENVHLLPHCTCREFIVSWVSLFTYLQFPDDNCPPREWLKMERSTDWDKIEKNVFFYTQTTRHHTDQIPYIWRRWAWWCNEKIHWKINRLKASFWLGSCPIIS